MKRCIGFLIPCCVFFSALVSCNPNKSAARRSVDYGKFRINYEVHGNSSKALVFIHGWTGSVKSWKYQVGAFPDYKVVAIDLPGNGESDKVDGADYSTSFFADSVCAVLKKEKISGAFFIGHSMGLAVCEIIAQKQPELCVGICSMDGSHFEVPDNADEEREWMEYNRSFAATMENESGREAFLNMLFLPDTPALLKEEVFAESRKVPLSIGKAMISGVERDANYWRKKTIRKPFLAIYSPAYQLPPDYGDELKKTYPVMEYHYIPDVSHFLMMEQPYRVNQIITDFLAEHY